MKKIFLIMTAFFLISCSIQEINNVLSIADDTPTPLPQFKLSAEACEKNIGVFNASTNLCTCKSPIPFSAETTCLASGSENAQAIVFSTNDKTRELHVFNEAGLLKSDLDTFIQSTSIPKLPKSRIYIFKDLKQFKTKNSKDNAYYLNTNFFMPEGSGKVETQIYFAPVATPNLRATGEIASTLTTILNTSFEKFKINQFQLVKDSTDCLSGCYIGSQFYDDANYTYSRIQTFYGGNRLFDTIRVQNKFDNKIEVVVVLFNQKVSHFYKAAGNGYFTVYTNAGEIVDYGASIKEI